MCIFRRQSEWISEFALERLGKVMFSSTVRISLSPLIVVFPVLIFNLVLLFGEPKKHHRHTAAPPTHLLDFEPCKTALWASRTVSFLKSHICVHKLNIFNCFDMYVIIGENIKRVEVRPG